MLSLFISYYVLLNNSYIFCFLLPTSILNRWLLHLNIAETFLIVYGISMVKYFSVFNNVLKCLYVHHLEDMLIW